MVRSPSLGRLAVCKLVRCGPILSTKCVSVLSVCLYAVLGSKSSRELGTRCRLLVVGAGAIGNRFFRLKLAVLDNSYYRTPYYCRLFGIPRSDRDLKTGAASYKEEATVRAPRCLKCKHPNTTTVMSTVTVLESSSSEKAPLQSALDMAKPQGSQRSRMHRIPWPATLPEQRKWQLEQMAGAFRLFAKLGFADGASGHISLRGP